jgi:hypothetical protein
VNPTNESAAARDADLIDRIAAALPPDVRADYYRELRHCQSLPENDEMLRILRVMQISVLLMVEAPGRVATERQRLEQVLGDAVQALEALQRSSEAHQADLDQRLIALPASIAEGISPVAIVATIDESLRQTFMKTTIPLTAEALGISAAQIKAAVGTFAKATTSLNDAHEGAVRKAREAIADLESVSSSAINRTRDAAEHLCRVFRDSYRWSLYTLMTIAFVTGVALGMEYMHWIDTPEAAQPTAPARQVQPVKPQRR